MKTLHAAFLCLVMIGISQVSVAQERSEQISGPLSGFSNLIGGKWYLDNSYQTFEWGLGKLSVKANSYFLVDGEAKLVSEGMWSWHPGLGELKGHFTAIDMPYSYFEYRTRFEENKMINELTTYSGQGRADKYLETWEFTGSDEFMWTLYSVNESDTIKYMEGKYKRK